VLRLLGEGGMSSVYAAEHVELGQVVALKALRVELEGKGELLARLQREARALAALAAHPHVVRVRDAGLDDAGRLFLAMDLLEGRTLGEELAARGAFSPPEAVALVRQLLSALGAAHALGIVHRDVKPANLFLTNDGVLKLLDFGVAKAYAEQGHGTALTAPGSRLGTPAFMAPEYLVRGAVDPRIDVYSAGVVLWQLLTARTPFPAEGEGHDGLMRLIRAVATRGVPALESVGFGHLPADLRGVVARATARVPDERYESADAFADAASRAVPAATGGEAARVAPVSNAARSGGAPSPGRPGDADRGTPAPTISLSAPTRRVEPPGALCEALERDATERDLAFLRDLTTPLTVEGAHADDSTSPVGATHDAPPAPSAAGALAGSGPRRGSRWWALGAVGAVGAAAGGLLVATALRGCH
jgi:serine/threonine-protein kinase